MKRTALLAIVLLAAACTTSNERPTTTAKTATTTAATTTTITSSTSTSSTTTTTIIIITTTTTSTTMLVIPRLTPDQREQWTGHEDRPGQTPQPAAILSDEPLALYAAAPSPQEQPRHQPAHIGTYGLPVWPH